MSLVNYTVKGFSPPEIESYMQVIPEITGAETVNSSETELGQK